VLYLSPTYGGASALPPRYPLPIFQRCFYICNIWLSFLWRSVLLLAIDEPSNFLYYFMIE
jgi:hypothetical protein